MEQAVFTTLCMVSDQNGNVLVQERRSGAWQGIAFPGGHVEPGESFTRSVIRELREETGYTLEDPLLCGVKQFQREDGSRYVILLYKAYRFHGELHSSEEGDVFWVKRSELPRFDLAHDMLAMLPLFEDDSKSEFYYYEDCGEWKYQII
ncbi:MAG: 8-oxo-dGTP diphosphatase [Eubacterium sp.]|nr:8-oxo-dGTP diphosphatase [Eubacterium sp.]